MAVFVEREQGGLVALSASRPAIGDATPAVVLVRRSRGASGSAAGSQRFWRQGGRGVGPITGCRRFGHSCRVSDLGARRDQADGGGRRVEVGSDRDEHRLHQVDVRGRDCACCRHSRGRDLDGGLSGTSPPERIAVNVIADPITVAVQQFSAVCCGFVGARPLSASQGFSGISQFRCGASGLLTAVLRKLVIRNRDFRESDCCNCDFSGTRTCYRPATEVVW